MNKIKLIITLLLTPFLLFHLIFFGIFYKRCKEDVKVNMVHAQLNGSVIIVFMYLIVFNRPFRNLFYWRIGKFQFVLMSWLFPAHHCFTLATNMKLGPGMTCIHPFATIVNASSIGKNFSVLNNVTIGNNKRNERPVIGNNVRINANSVVIGKIVIGNNVTIGAGSVVTKSIPDNCVVIGNPAYVLRENGVLVKRSL